VTSAELIAAVPVEVPERIVARVREVLAAHPQWQVLPAAESLVNVADELLRGVLAQRDGNGSPRDQALDLLAADACVTWAFEAAADQPGSLGAHASATMERFAAVVVS
jgi:hypothetical protein